MTNTLLISDYSVDTQIMNLINHNIRTQGIKTELISPKSFHLDVLFDHQYGHPKVRLFKKQVEASNQIYVVFQAWNKPLLWLINAMFKFISKEELKGKNIVPIVITEAKTCKNEVYYNFSTIFKDYFNEAYSKWIFIQKELISN
ncbi:hypothetical protein WQ54_21205 [Bacillus sp. SA1-12]|uniref:hypothetical protein n=1 Tax=Bacillus sp. SA1-12 TaxID=1455638 RepID=UPI000627021D|nr:hypothetical protein [Bacillus sp. SA1-12]KKI90471.1 hypothetical protein WQ54_21205 [Bacillus sp. SA1-12]